MTTPTFRGGPQGPAYDCFAIVPNNTNPLPKTPKAIRANTAGAVVLRMIDSDADVTLTMLAGETVYGIVTHVRDTGTAATLHGFA